MKQTAPISSVPDRDALMAAARGYLADPRFGEAARVFCRELLATHHRRIANLGLADTAHWAIANLLLILDARAGGRGVIAATLGGLCEQGGIAGHKAVRNTIGVFRAVGLASAAAMPGDARAVALRPTPLLRDALQTSLAARLSGLALVQPLPLSAADWAAVPGVLEAFIEGDVRAYAEHGFKLYDGFPLIRFFMDRTSGYLALLALYGSLAPDGKGRFVARLRYGEIGERLDVSRTHVRKLFKDAVAQHWVHGVERGGVVVVTATTEAELRLWLALEFAWMWHKLGSRG